MTFYEILKSTGLPCAYSHFTEDNKPKSPPYIVYIGAGQDTFNADDTYYYRQERRQVEYYFTKKDERQEAVIEDLFLENGFIYSKSEDIYIESEGVFVIYYQV